MSGGAQKILIVDDDPDLVSALTTILEKNNYKVISAPNSVVGFKKAKEENPGLIIVDIVMDTYSEGFTFIKNLLTDSQTKDIPKIILSSLGLQQNLDMIYPEELGTKNILQKPVQADVLLASVKSALMG